MKSKGERIVAGCLMGKVLTSRNVNKKGLKLAMQQAWQTIREVKVDAMGENIFMFKFTAKIDKKRAIASGPWLFNGALIVFRESMGVGEVSKQSFTNASFRVQLKNSPLCVWIKKRYQSWEQEQEKLKKQMPTENALEKSSDLEYPSILLSP